MSVVLIKVTVLLPEGFAIFVDCSFPVLILKKVVSNILHILSNRQNFVNLEGNTDENATKNFNSISFILKTWLLAWKIQIKFVFLFFLVLTIISMD